MLRLIQVRQEIIMHRLTILILSVRFFLNVPFGWGGILGFGKCCLGSGEITPRERHAPGHGFTTAPGKTRRMSYTTSTAALGMLLSSLRHFLNFIFVPFVHDIPFGVGTIQALATEKTKNKILREKSLALEEVTRPKLSIRMCFILHLLGLPHILLPRSKLLRVMSSLL